MEAHECTSYAIPITVTGISAIVSTHLMGSTNGSTETQGIYKTNNSIYIKAFFDSGNISSFGNTSHVLIINT